MKCFVLIFFVCFFQTTAYCYWQQEVKYDIEVELNDKKHELVGKETIVYYNNSPDTLSELYFHLWPNAYKTADSQLGKQLLKQGETKLYYTNNKVLGFIDSLNFTSADNSIRWSYVDAGEEIAVLFLETQLQPGDSITITTPFRVKIPKSGISRLGHGKDSYQITQWYPKPVVYDKSGWHPMHYLDQGEFYSEFGSFNVALTLPADYVVAATGDLVGGDLLLNSKLKEKKVSQTKKILSLGYSQIDSTDFNEFANKVKTLKYFQDRVHDFAIFADKDWLILRETILPLGNSDSVIVESMFLPENLRLWKNSLKYLINGLNFYCKEVGPYPYAHCTAVDAVIGAGAGMEYPKVTVIGETHDKLALEEALVHEVGHNWFYGMLGSNERDFSWMDEGVNSYFERKYFAATEREILLSDYLGSHVTRLLGDNDPKMDKMYWYTYLMAASRSTDQKTNINAELFYGDNYGAAVYAKGAVLFNYLEQYIGSDRMRYVYRKYFSAWKYKHPNPTDFRTHFEKELNLDLSWFFDQLLYDNEKLDYAIAGITTIEEDGLVELQVRNRSNITAPIVIDVVRSDSIIKTVWFDGFLGDKKLVFDAGDYDQIEIDRREIIPDINRENNFISKYGWFKKMEPMETNFLFSTPNQSKTQIFYTPFLAYNANDKLQLGVLLYNSLVEEKKLRYVFMPTFGFGSKQLTGYYKGIYSQRFRNSWWHKLNYSLNFRKIGLEGQIASGFKEKIEPKITLFGGVNTNTKHVISARYSRISTKIWEATSLRNEYFTGTYEIRNEHALHPYSLSISTQLINGNSNKSWIEYKQEIPISQNLKAFELRIFAGTFLGSSPNDLTHRFRLTAGNGANYLVESGGGLIDRGMTDYLLDDIYLARNQSSLNFLSQQVSERDGAFRTGLVLGATNSWVSAVNLTSPSPSKLVSIFSDFGLYPGVGSKIYFAYVAGIQLNILNDIFEIYLPFFTSENITDNYEAQGLSNYSQRIKFSFNLGQYYNLID